MNAELVDSVCRERRAQNSAIRQCQEAWYREELVTDEVWLLAHFGSTASIAKMRLKASTRADREACGDGKWVCCYRPTSWLFDAVMNACWHGGEITYRGRRVSMVVALRFLKPRYRWERRR
jgi:hypothetical protein